MGFTLIPQWHQVQASISQSSPLPTPQLIQQGRELYQAEQYTQAVDVWRAALKAETNILSQAMLLNYLSLAYQELGQWQQANETINSSLNLIQQSKQTTPQAKLILLILKEVGS